MIGFDEFVKRSNELYQGKYIYNEKSYVNTSTKTLIICPIHGEFWQLPKDHMKGHECPKCSLLKRSLARKLTTEEFIEKAKKVHGDKYDYSKVDYINNSTKVCIICNKHGEFWQIPNNHLKGQGCPMCTKNKKLTTSEFIKRAEIVHGNEYNYSKVDYINAKSKVNIICPTHGEFWQIAEFHLRGCGCPICNSSKLENEIRLFLQENNIEFEEQKKFEWLGKQSLDFYLIKYNIGIECQGIQHFEERDLFEPLDIIQERDNKKFELCSKNGIKIIYYSNLNIKYPYKVLKNKKELLKEIQSYGTEEEINS